MSEPNNAEPVRYSGTFTSGPDYARRSVYAGLTATLFRPARIVPRLVIVALVLLLGVSVDLSTRDGWQVLLIALCVVVLFALPTLLAYPIAARVARKRMPVGSTYSIELRDATVTMVSPDVSSTVAYGYYQSCEKRGTFVLLRQRISRRLSMLPIELFTDESYEFLLAHIQPAKAATKQDA